MSKLHAKLIDPNQFEPKEGQCDDFACSNKKSIPHCPSLDYKCVTPSEDMVNKAFDILFEEVMKIKED
jgi:hypothetical protein